jgi:hypothetical protein
MHEKNRERPSLPMGYTVIELSNGLGAAGSAAPALHLGSCGLHRFIQVDCTIRESNNRSR